MAAGLPSKMKALIKVEGPDDPLRPGDHLRLMDKPLPVLGKGDVLVKMEAASANPSDLLSLRGRYATNAAPGQICGIEGVGRVVASNAGVKGAFFKGRRVAVAKPAGDGVWAEYAAIGAQYCIPVGDDLPVESAAAFIVNPFTSHALINKARRKNCKAVIHNGAAGQVGQGIIALARSANIECISIVRRASQAEDLKAMGARHVLDQSSAGFDDDLKRLCANLKPGLFFDSVGGAMTAQVMEAMPENSDVIVLGYLEENAGGQYIAHFPNRSLIFKNQSIQAFWLAPYFVELGQIGGLKASLDILKLFKSGVFRTHVGEFASFEDYPEAINRYAADMSRGKSLLRC